MKLDLSKISEHCKHFSPSVDHKNVFRKEDLDWLIEFMFRSTENWRLGVTGNLFFSGNFKKIIKKYWDIFDGFVDLSSVVSVKGNFFHTPHQYGFHTDMPEEIDESFVLGDAAYKSILIPLYMLPMDSLCHLLLFNERLLSYGTTLDKGPTKSKTHYNSYSDYEGIDFIFDTNGDRHKYSHREFDKDVFDKYNLGSTSPPSRFEGFSVESVFDWKPGNAIVFDTTQLHCSNLGLDGKYFRSKAGLRISLFRNYLGNRDPIKWDRVTYK